MKEFLAFLSKYLPAVLVGVHAAQTVGGATNVDKRSVVVSEVVGIADAIATASGNSEVKAVALMVDIAASVINALAKKAATPAPAAAAAVFPAVKPPISI